MKFLLLIFLLAASNILIYSSFIKITALSPSISFFDVGQGDSSLIQINGIDILIDAGRGRRVIYEIEKVLSKQDKYIDIALITHPHKDHYEGLNYILDFYEIGIIIWNGAEPDDELKKIFDKARQKEISIINLFAGSTISSNDLQMKIIHPQKETSDSLLQENDGSLVIFASLGEITGLFTGDITHRTESILATIDFPKTDVLKIAHHGSRTSSSYNLISSLMPTLAVLPVGHNNYGLPDEDVLERFNALNIPVFRTDKEGGVRITKDNNKIQVRSLE